ncbi:oxygenase MpaB family protein [Neobacillus sp. WH10]|uniref:oxygenase MpaB family protein n=1 Tax=Neobacillus sp. WH10 TaxID=3047873 RepID=UPI0024C17755|nr:oxygenase MpaB family protein [Neobacillus sp. WH10]WHY76848.1 oxygenase MpaB family protein [Neobacillus sp. WH10]
MLYTDEFMECLRMEGDPIPDQIIEELFENSQVGTVNALLRQLMNNDQSYPEELPDNIEFWLKDTACCPDGVDWARMRNAAELFQEHGIAITLLLATSSLVHCYAARKGVKVLTFSYRLGQNAYRRIAETGQFVLQIMSPGGLESGGQGIKSIQKVRLMHSAIRHLIQKTGRWDEKELGIPICQEDLLGTLLTFSSVIIDGLRRLGMKVTEEQAEDYLYFWKIVGGMMGIREDIIPQTMEQSAILAETIGRRHHGPSPEGVQMTRALLEFHADLIPGQMFDNIVPALIRELVGDEIADWMEVPRSDWQKLMKIKELMGLFLDSDYTGVLGSMTNRLGLALLQRQSLAMTDYEYTPFLIPTELRKVWGISENKDKGV